MSKMLKRNTDLYSACITPSKGVKIRCYPVPVEYGTLDGIGGVVVIEWRDHKNLGAI